MLKNLRVGINNKFYINMTGILNILSEGDRFNDEQALGIKGGLNMLANTNEASHCSCTGTGDNDNTQYKCTCNSNGSTGSIKSDGNDKPTQP